MTDLKNDNYSIKQYLQEIVQNSLDIFRELTSWSDKDKKEYVSLLEELKKPFYERLKEGVSFFELIRAKKIALRLSSNYDNFFQEYHHDGIDSVMQKIQSL